MKRANAIPAGIEAYPLAKVPTRQNPRTNRDYIISLKKTQSFALLESYPSGDATIEIRFVPDRLICDEKLMEVYFASLAAQACSGLEELANAVADDFSNELIPRWISVDISLSVNGLFLGAHVEDKQPLWNNPALLQR
ncbi:MAG: hypothetical protein ACSLFL_00940 [Alphaproteobacteria bacterium]